MIHHNPKRHQQLPLGDVTVSDDLLRPPSNSRKSTRGRWDTQSWLTKVQYSMARYGMVQSSTCK